MNTSIVLSNPGWRRVLVLTRDDDGAYTASVYATDADGREIADPNGVQSIFVMAPRARLAEPHDNLHPSLWLGDGDDTATAIPLTPTECHAIARQFDLPRTAPRGESVT